jgi:hypothetical protein
MTQLLYSLVAGVSRALKAGRATHLIGSVVAVDRRLINPTGGEKNKCPPWLLFRQVVSRSKKSTNGGTDSQCLIIILHHVFLGLAHATV